MSDFCDKCERVDDLCADDASCNKLKAEVERLTQVNKRMFLRDFKEHPMVVGLERQHECDKALYVAQFERAEKIEYEIRGVLDSLPDSICVRPGGGPEDILQSLAVSVRALQKATSCEVCGKLEIEARRLEAENEQLKKEINDAAR
jgi:hypothetical protein